MALVFSSIQYHYVFDKQQKLKSLLIYYLQKNAENIKKVLLFIKKCANYRFYPQFYKQTLKRFSTLPEYQQIQQKLKQGGQAISLYNKYEEVSKQKSKLSINVFNRPIPQLQHQQDSTQTDYYLKYIKIIMKIQNIQAGMMKYYIAIIYQCIRFDESNIECSQKAQIANKINPLLISYLALNTDIKGKQLLPKLKGEKSQQINSIKTLVLTLFNFCLRQGLDKLIKEYLFKFYQQLIIINVNCTQFFQVFLNFINQHQHSLDPYFIINELQQLQRIICLMKSYSLEQQYVYYRIISKIQTLQKKIIENQQEFYSQFQLNHQCLYEAYQQRLKQLQQISNLNTKKRIFYILIINAHEHIFKSGKITEIVRVIELVKKSPYFYNFSSLVRSKIMIDLMHGAENTPTITHYLELIASIINCPEVYTHIDQEKYFITYNNSLDIKIQRLIEKLTRSTYGSQIYHQFFDIFNHILMKEEQDRLRTQLVQLYHTYQREKYKIKNIEQTQNQIYFDVYLKAKLQGFFYDMCDETKPAFLQTLGSYEQELLAIQRLSQQQSTFIKYRAIMYKWYCILLQDNYSESLYQQSRAYLQSLIKIYKQINFFPLIIESIKNLIKTSLRWQIPQQYLVSPITQLYNYSKQLNHLVYVREQNYCIPTFYVFAKYNKPAFTELLLTLTQFLSLNLFHSTKTYFINLINSIDFFLRVNPRSYLLHYSYFVQNGSSADLQANPYLLIFYAYSLYYQQNESQLRLLKVFALNCDYLPKFAKNKLLERYYRVLMIHIGTKSKSKRVFAFRLGINYIGAAMKSKLSKQLLKVNKKNVFHTFLKKKVTKLIEK